MDENVDTAQWRSESKFSYYIPYATMAPAEGIQIIQISYYLYYLFYILYSIFCSEPQQEVMFHPNIPITGYSFGWRHRCVRNIIGKLRLATPLRGVYVFLQKASATTEFNRNRSLLHLQAP